MKTWRYILFFAGCVFLLPILLFLLAVIGLMPDHGPLHWGLGLCYIEAGYWLHEIGEPGFLSSTAGHMPHLTMLGMFLIYGLPACVCFWKSRLLRTK